MNKILALFISVLLPLVTMARQSEYPIHLVGNHIYTRWTINENIQATVFLESAFPKIVFDEKFVRDNIDQLNVVLLDPGENAYIRMWIWPQAVKVSGIIRDTVSFNGKKIYVDALVADISDRPRDIIFPVYCMPEPVELDISGETVKIGRPEEEYLRDFHAYPITLDSTFLSPYINSTLTVYDPDGDSESVSGDFLFDLGNSNALVLNRSHEKVPHFLEAADRMTVKDTTRFTPNPRIELGILWPEKFGIANMLVTDNYIPVMKLDGRHLFFVGILGNRFFKNFIVVFDSDSIYLKPVGPQVIIR
ncbi:MAG: hypothetical protein LIO77_05910 [Rikenellaceae bacterium]|nr:hypothetical protein [Rikenellaceae bacterium]